MGDSFSLIAQNLVTFIANSVMIGIMIVTYYILRKPSTKIVESAKNHNCLIMKDLSYREIYDILCSAISPRPIGFISTIQCIDDGNGNIKYIKNLAPLSFCCPVTADPPSVMFSVTTPRSNKNKNGGKQYKDTLLNIRETKEFVVNHVSTEFFDKVYEASNEFERSIDEFDTVGLTAIDSKYVLPKRVKESPIQLECKLIDIISINGQNYGGSHVIIGQIIAAHIRQDCQTKDELCNEQLINTVSRLGGLRYGNAKSDFEINKGAWSKNNW